MAVEPQDLKSRIGSEILIYCKLLKAEGLESAILHGVEAGGIWIETANINETVLGKIGEPMSDHTPLMFLPYHSIDAILSGTERPIISDKFAE